MFSLVMGYHLSPHPSVLGRSLAEGGVAITSSVNSRVNDLKSEEITLLFHASFQLRFGSA